MIKRQLESVSDFFVPSSLFEACLYMLEERSPLGHEFSPFDCAAIVGVVSTRSLDALNKL